MEAGFAGLVVLIWIASIFALFWVHGDASRRYDDEGLGCLWALMVLALGPIALIAYLMVRPAEPPLISGRGSDRPEIKSTRACPGCGLENDWNQHYCRSCGRELRRRRPKPSGQIPKQVTCQSCKRRVPSGSYCSNCGEPLEEIEEK